MGSKRLANNNGSQDAILKSIKATQPSIQLSKLSDKEKQLAEQILQNIFNSYESIEDYERNITSKSTDAILGRIASLLDEVKDDFSSNELTDVKNYIVNSLSSVIKNNKTKSIDIDIEAITLQISDTITSILNDKIDNLIQTLTEFFNEKFSTIDNGQNSLDSKLDEINSKDSSSEEILIEESSSEKKINTTDNKEKISKEESISEEASLKETTSEEIEEEKTEEEIPIEEKNVEINEANNKDQKLEIINLLNSILDQFYNKIDNLILSIEESQTFAKINFENINKLISGLVPTNKEKKKNKEEKKEREEIYGAIRQIKKLLDSVSEFCNNFIDFWVANFKTLLNKVAKILAAFVLRLLLTIVFPAMAIIALGLQLIAEPLIRILQPICDMLKPISEGIGSILDSIGTGFTYIFGLLKDIGEFLLQGIKDIWNAVVVPFFKGFGSNAYAIGAGLSNFVLIAVKILTLFLEGMKSHAYAIGEGLGRFIKTVLNVLADLMAGFGTHAKAIGEGLGRFILTVVDILADLMEGIKTHAKAIGEKISEICLVIVDMILDFLKFIKNLVNNIVRLVQMYVIAPFNALRQKIITFATLLAGKKFIGGIGVAILGREPTDEDFELAEKNKDKSFTDFLNEEQNKLEKQYAAEDNAKALAELNAKMQQKKIEQMLDSIHVIDDMFALVKDIHQYLFKDNTKQTIATSIQVIQPNLNSIYNIENQTKENQSFLAESLDNKNENLKKSNNKNKLSNNNGNDFYSNLMLYLDKKFGIILTKLDDQALIPIPIQQTKTNKDFVKEYI